MKWYHAFLYITAIIWNITIAWPATLLIRLFWGENLRWEQRPDEILGDGPSLWCDLKPDSWPARTWYEKWGGISSEDGWRDIQHHEHRHVEQFEAAMLRSFIVGGSNAVVLAALGHPIAALVVGLVTWWAGYLLMGIANWLTAALRGEDPYRGSHHEEAAYDSVKARDKR